MTRGVSISQDCNRRQKPRVFYEAGMICQIKQTDTLKVRWTDRKMDRKLTGK